MPMTMRQDCAHFQTRTYDDDGEVARFCTLGLAPEAPWRCPDPCAKYEQILMIAADFEAGSLAHAPLVEPEPDAAPQDIIDVLADAEQIVHDVEASVAADFDREQPRRWWTCRRRDRNDNDPGLSNR